MNVVKHRVLLGVAGGIAACKTPELVRLLKMSGIDVRVCMTTNAHRFVASLTLQALSGQSVVSDQFATDEADGMDHIAIARWADTIIVAPATAGVIARLANGMADDLLTTIVMASNAAKLLAPAMNMIMWKQPQLQRNLELLRNDGWLQLPVGCGDQACGEYGEGRMLEPEQILYYLQSTYNIEKKLSGVRVLITAGSTREAIDPVRFLSNCSSGKMGYALAQAATMAGAKVTLISGYVSIKPIVVDNLVKVSTAREMYEQAMSRHDKTDIFIASAAVADYTPVDPQTQKIKKSNATLQLELQQTADIVADFAVRKRPDQYIVGFAAETDNVLENARNKLMKKKLDMVIANRVGIADQGFESDYNQAVLITKNGDQQMEKMLKTELAVKIIDAISSTSLFST